MMRKEYRTKRLVLRAFRMTDFAVWKRCHELRKPKINKFDADPLPPERRTREEFSQLVQRQRKNAKDDRIYVWNIFLASSGELVGRIDIAPIVRDPYHMANLGYLTFNHHRGHGYAAEAVKKLIPVGLKELKFHRLEAAIDPDNQASIQLAKTTGLYREGIKKHYWFQNNRWEDQLVFIATPELFG